MWGIEEKLWEIQGSQQSITYQQELLGEPPCAQECKEVLSNFCALGPQINVRMQPCIDSRTSKPIYVTKKKKVIRIEREGFLEKACLRES